MHENGTPTLLTREGLLALRGPAIEIVNFPGLGAVRVRGLTGRELDDWQTSILRKDTKKATENATARFVALCVVDEHGHRVFTTEADIAALGEVRGDVLQGLWRVGARLSGLTKGDIQELGKASGIDLDAGSTSGSPTGSATPA